MSSFIGTPSFSESGTIEAEASSAWYPIWFPFNILVTGEWSGDWVVDVSSDNGATSAPATAGGTPATFNTNGFYPCPNVYQKGLLFRITRGVGSGTMNYTISGQDVVA